ncbi:hypothetical protein GF376_00140 [Candidatus Peregrinibacteria bacterium]|nr:hypothetical protein [Candidatus Peregrinibacteria bacterium]
MNIPKLTQFKYYQNIYIIGIGGIGISGLTQILFEGNKSISGSDIQENNITKSLRNSKINVNIGHNSDNITDKYDLIIHSSAIPADNPELLEAKRLNIKTLTYPEALGLLTKDYRTITISGTHGKTTTTAMTYEALSAIGIDPTVIVGTTYPSFNNKNYHLGKSEYLLIEACEYKNAFLNYHPDIALITGVEPDHFDFFKSKNNYINAFRKFLRNIKKNGKVIFNENDNDLLDLVNEKEFSNLSKIKYDRSKNLGKLFGNHNQENAAGAYTIAKQLTEDPLKMEYVIEKLKNFKGTSRRMEYLGKIGKTKVFDDYAHHPTAIKKTLEGYKKTFPDEKILCVFQPHQYSRTKKLFKEFANSFTACEKVIIPNIYEARDSDKDKESINAKILVEAINEISKNKAIDGINHYDTLEIIKSISSQYNTIIVMGAGDITNLAHQLV